MTLFYLFIPQNIELDWDWQRLILATSSAVEATIQGFTGCLYS
jgi:hypothetical protein